MVNLPETLNDSLSRIRGRTLSSVEFVQDYVQLRFDGPTLTAYTQPHLVQRGKTIFWGSSMYRDSLCALIGVRVTDTEVADDKELTLVFENGMAVKVSLKSKDYRGPEALQFVDENGSFWVA